MNSENILTDKTAEKLYQEIVIKGVMGISADLAFDVANFFYKIEDDERANHIYALLILHEKNLNPQSQYLLRKRLAITTYSLNNFRKAVTFFTDLKKFPEFKNNELEQLAVFNNLGNSYLHLKQFKKALQCYLSAYRLCSNQKHCKNKNAITASLGNLYYFTKQYDLAIKFYKESLAIEQAPNTQVKVLNTLGLSYLKLGKIKQANSYLAEAFNISIKEKLAEELEGTLANLSFLYDKTDNKKEFEKFLKRALSFLPSNSKNHIRFSVYHLAARMYLKNRDFATAELYFNKILKAPSQDIGNITMTDVFNDLGLFYEHKNDFKSALKMYKKGWKLKDQLTNSENTRIIREVSTRYEVEAKVKEAELERLRNVELKDALSRIEIEKETSEKLLLNILPKNIADELKQNGVVKPRKIDNATVMFIDIESFTSKTTQLHEEKLVGLLDYYFGTIDDIIDKYHIEKIKTIGDAYLCVGGLKTEHKNHADEIVLAALEIISFIKKDQKLRIRSNSPYFNFRIGIHTGPLIAGLVGKKKFEFDIWGDTVNVAARMEQTGEILKINISENTLSALQGNYNIFNRGELMVKNKGMMTMYFVESIVS